ncbi:Signal transduction histidine kinase [Abditibacterium utsteinense]|uniref:histidine kinase n=2 Tax=Abditibacterium utsteinense TaxID=1960156 RepID=A0A2S8SNS7_9BACT|nr:Signal transduction histidine kinase [Abditibacterium utsteinense]
MRARMTALFAFFVAFLMLMGGAAVQHREARRAENRTREILTVARQRARAELFDVREKHQSLLQVVLSAKDEIAAGGLILMVVQGEKILWQSRRRAPRWPKVGDGWRVQTLFWHGQTLVLAHEWEPIQDELRETAASLWELGVIVVFATAFAAWFVVGKTLSPLGRLAAQAKNASIESLQVRLQTPSSDAEMRHLTATLNDLLTRLEREAKARGRFYAAASHELRTPIQVLLGEIDVAKSRPRSIEQHEIVLNQLQSHSERLATLVQDLLQLNALEMGQNQAPREEINLRFWVERAISQQSAALEARGLHLQSQMEDMALTAPPQHVEVLLRNLLENAVKYAAINSTLQIEIEAANGALRFWNAGNIAPEPNRKEPNLNVWFEPFFRPDASRNSQTGGNGLGLTICSAICRANHWDISLQTQNGGILAEVRFNSSRAILP